MGSIIPYTILNNQVFFIAHVINNKHPLYCSSRRWTAAGSSPWTENASLETCELKSSHSTVGFYSSKKNVAVEPVGPWKMSFVSKVVIFHFHIEKKVRTLLNDYYREKSWGAFSLGKNLEVFTSPRRARIIFMVSVEVKGQNSPNPSWPATNTLRFPGSAVLLGHICQQTCFSPHRRHKQRKQWKTRHDMANTKTLEVHLYTKAQEVEDIWKMLSNRPNTKEVQNSKLA